MQYYTIYFKYNQLTLERTLIMYKGYNKYVDNINSTNDIDTNLLWLENISKDIKITK